MAAIRSGILVLLICALPTSASAGCGLFSPCGSPSWIGFSLALPVPRLPHLHTFCHRGCQSPMCGAGPWVGSGFGHGGCGLGGCGLGHCGNPCFAPAPCTPPLLSSPPIMTPPPAFPSTTCDPCGPAVSQMQYVPRQTVTYRDVPQTQFRQEAYTATVPVTTYQQVTQYRSVPYQTVTRIPQVSTQYVPQVTAAAPCNPCMTGLSTPTYGYGSTASLPYGMAPLAQPQTAYVPEYPYPVAQPQADATSDWQTVPRRQAQEPTTAIQQMGYSPAYSPAFDGQPGPQSLFRPAPSAATAWQSRWLR